jgi:hypothetical protein
MAATSRPHRPFVVPESLAELDGPTVTGRVRLPLHLDWSSSREYDLDDPTDRARVYEIVLREGTLDDLRTYVDPTVLADALQRMFLPSAIAEAWRALLDAEPSGLGR